LAACAAGALPAVAARDDVRAKTQEARRRLPSPEAMWAAAAKTLSGGEGGREL
jgi:alpha-D-ribose 1-methylphosphonate 5-triphosphate synthase subunit PhnL